jgi:hypothetical protein
MTCWAVESRLQYSQIFPVIQSMLKSALMTPGSASCCIEWKIYSSS